MFPHFLCGPVFRHMSLHFIVMCMLKQLLIKKDKNKTTYYIRYLFTPRVITELTAKLSHLIILVLSNKMQVLANCLLWYAFFHFPKIWLYIS